MTRTQFLLLPLATATLVLNGCQSGAKFLRTDATYQTHRGSAVPRLFIDQPPSAQYRQVGVFQLSAPAERSEAEVAETLLQPAQETGCDLLISKRFAQGVTRDSAPLRFRFVQHEGHDHSMHERPRPEPVERPTREESSATTETRERGGGVTIEHSRTAMRTFEFVCGVQVTGDRAL